MHNSTINRPPFKDITQLIQIAWNVFSPLDNVDEDNFFKAKVCGNIFRVC